MSVTRKPQLMGFRRRQMPISRLIYVKRMGKFGADTQLSEIVQRVRDGRLRTNIGTVSTLDDAVAAFNPTERRPGKTIIRVRPRGILPFSPSPLFGMNGKTAPIRTSCCDPAPGSSPSPTSL
jgi:hypothetical protein